MNCRDSESLILAERDGALTKDQLAALSDHVATCPACAKLRTNLAAALDTYQAGLRAVPAPNADEAWRELQSRLNGADRREKKRPLSPVIWFGASLAAAAAFAFAFLITRPTVPPSPAETLLAVAPPPLHDPSFIAGADYVEAGDPDASVLVFVDKESGWLVVWATDSDTATSG
jgi:anti-sigma factor RsiW